MQLSPKYRSALNALEDALQAHGIRKFGQGWPGRNVVQVDQWRRQFYAYCVGNSPEAKKKAFQRARSALTAGGHILISEDYAWLCPDSPGENGYQGLAKEMA